MINAAVVSNGLYDIKQFYADKEDVKYNVLEITKDFDPDLTPYQLLIVPNGSDHIAMAKIKKKVADFLDRGNTLFCFDGWFTDWIPGNQWIMDNTRKTIDIRYHIKDDPHHLMAGVDIDHLTRNHGISGWWACGYIDAEAKATVLLEDTWQRPIIVVDEHSTKGVMVLSASGPLGDSGAIPTEPGSSMTSLVKLYQNCLSFINQKQLA